MIEQLDLFGGAPAPQASAAVAEWPARTASPAASRQHPDEHVYAELAAVLEAVRDRCEACTEPSRMGPVEFTHRLTWSYEEWLRGRWTPRIVGEAHPAKRILMAQAQYARHYVANAGQTELAARIAHAMSAAEWEAPTQTEG